MRVLAINDNLFVMPEGMTTRQTQSLIGFLVQMQTVESHYNFTTGAHMFDLGNRFADVRMVEVTITPDAKAKHDQSYTDYMSAKEKKAAQAT